MTTTHLTWILAGYAVKAAVSYALWRRFGGRVRSLGRLMRRRRRAGRPVLARATPGHVARTFRLGPPANRAEARQTDRTTEAPRPPRGHPVLPR